jgi:hypothetical protein
LARTSEVFISEAKNEARRFLAGGGGRDPAFRGTRAQPPQTGLNLARGEVGVNEDAGQEWAMDLFSGS